MITTIIKRDGREVPYQESKLKEAIIGAFVDIDKEITDQARQIADKIASEFANIHKSKMSVEEVQDTVEQKLMQTSRKDVAKQFILYRDQRSREREKRSAFMRAVTEKLTASNVQNQNANVDEYSFGGRKGEANSELMKKFALDYCMSEMSRENHLNNEVYIHDLDSYAVGQHNCLSVPFDKLLANGFNTRQTDVRPAQSVNTAFQLVAVIFQLQSLQQFGGVSATHLDWTMVPYVRKSFARHYFDGMKYLSDKYIIDVVAGVGDRKCDYKTYKKIAHLNAIDDRYIYSDEKAYEYAMDMTEKEIYQAVEGMYHNLK